MYRLAYRNFGDHESLVVNHSVTAGSSVGVRWYELRNPSGDADRLPAGHVRARRRATAGWAAIAMDKSGDIALGYSISSSALHPGDPLHRPPRRRRRSGTMTQGEGIVITGAGSQTGGLTRWGDYTSMSVDPGDDCTFWYTNEYIPANGTFNWRTRIGSFKLPGCGGPRPTDFSISASPASLSVARVRAAPRRSRRR